MFSALKPQAMPAHALAVLCLLLTVDLVGLDLLHADAAGVGTPVSYQLPAEGPLPRTYRVTLAAVDSKHPNWIVSTFAAGVVRTVTTQNQGKFTENWDGLDENFMPVPPGKYGVKGIFMPSQKWAVDGLDHTIIPKLVSVGCSWGQTPAQDMLPDKIQGDPVASPFRDVDVQPDGKGVLYFQYLENGTNAFLTDFTKPIGYDQIVTGYSSGGIGGGTCACTDGHQIWMVADVEQQFIVHADGTPFGTQSSNYCRNVYLPDGWVTGASAATPAKVGSSVLFLAEHGKAGRPKPDAQSTAPAECDQVVALDGQDARVLATWKVERPLSVKARGGTLYVLHTLNGHAEVLAIKLDSAWKEGRFKPVLALPRTLAPFDLEVDSHGLFYVSDSAANHVYQFSAQGQLLHTFGRLKEQRDGTYDPLTFMGPEKLGTWTDSTGQDRLLIVEQQGPNRLSEWSGTDGKLIREWVVPQTLANTGYCVDPQHTDMVYLLGQGAVLVRWKIDAASGKWSANAVWKKVGFGYGPKGAAGEKFFQVFGTPRIVYHGNDRYIAFGHGYAVYDFEVNRCRACMAVLRRKDAQGQDKTYLWCDLNGDGLIEPEEYLPGITTTPPGAFARYFGDTWFEDLSLACICGWNPDIWRLAPVRYDPRGTPIFDAKGSWKHLLTDEVFRARKAGTADPLHGGNEMASDGFDSSWASVAQGEGGSYYVDARFGPDFSANSGGQFKLTRYDRDASGNLEQRWRVGRMAFQGNARPGEVYGSIYDCSPTNGLVALIDSARAGAEVYTTDGLYVDTLFPDGQVVPQDRMGAYWQPGEYFAGGSYVDRPSGKVMFTLGKTMPKIYEAQGWTATQNPVRPLTGLPASVTLTADEIGAPPPLALQMRGGAAAARVAQFSPSPGGGPALDGGMRGWEASDPITYSPGGDKNVEVRCLYDLDHLYLRWHARIGYDFEAHPLGQPEGIFSHDRGNDTLGLYLQGDPHAAPGAPNPGGRPGDVRFVFGIFKDGNKVHPEVVGMYPGEGKAGGARSVTYRTPVGSAHFGRVELVPGARTACTIDADRRGFVLSAALPRSAIPGAPGLNGWRTEGNFDANFGGVNRFWWSNADGSASRETFDEPTESRLYPGSWSPVRLLPIDTLPVHSWMAIGPFGFADLPKLDSGKRERIIQTLLSIQYPPESERDWAATYDGDLTHTRGNQHALSWRALEVSADHVDGGKDLGWSGAVDGENDDGVCFLVTHVFSPQAVSIRLRIDLPDGDHDLSGKLNGEALAATSEKGQQRIDTTEPIKLRAGWNELVLRYTYIWGENHLGATLVGDPAVLWKLKISGRGPG